MTAKLTVVDYGLGNLYSVCRAFESLGANVKVSADPDEITQADRLLLPGVGSFAKGIEELDSRGLSDALREYISTSRPFLGICLGMQLLFDSSEEFGLQNGLGLIPGRVVAIPRKGDNGILHKIPHIGWASLEMPESRNSWNATILKDVSVQSSTYFVHSYTAFPEDINHRLADCDYDGCLISAAVQANNIFGCQFHPEKSGEIGLKILRNFLAI